MRYATKQDVEVALSNSMYKPKHNLFIRVLAFTGVRVSEAINIRPRDLKEPMLQLVVIGKGNEPRNIDITYNLMNSLKVYIKHEKIKDHERIFPFTRRNGFYITDKYCGLNPHAFRHFYAIRLMQHSKNIRYVQKQLGHSSISTTQYYLQFMEFDQEKKQLEEIFK